MESDISTTAPPPGRQLLCVSLEPTPELRDLARQAALHLETLSFLESITWASSEPQRTELFKARWEQQFNKLHSETLKFAAPIVKDIVAGIPGATIRNRKEGDASAGIYFANETMITTRPGEFHILHPLPISEKAYIRIVNRIQELLPTLQFNSPGNTKLLLQSDANREIKEELAFMDRIHILKAARYGTIPRLWPLLMTPAFVSWAMEEHGR